MSEADPAEIETELEIVIDIEIDLAELNDDEREDLDRLHKGAIFLLRIAVPTAASGARCAGSSYRPAGQCDPASQRQQGSEVDRRFPGAEM
ncbi:hypothetical protein OG563_25955 [Nocardia vinacea]|uniref:Uncharacterized protein n=1 Tax=Nocardia vinacea TaxID=96468 RepID=A0ABZ1YK75_9NOCA|nr:hypothetical protein [Nocardia vinacea]